MAAQSCWEDINMLDDSDASFRDLSSVFSYICFLWEKLIQCSESASNFAVECWGWFRTVIAVSTLAWMLNESNLSWVFIQLFLQVSAILSVYNVIQTFGTVFAQLQRWVNTQKRWIAILKSICSSSQPSTMVPAIFLWHTGIFLKVFYPKIRTRKQSSYYEAAQCKHTHLALLLEHCEVI